MIKRKKEINDLYLPSAVFIAQMLVWPSKQLKQIFQITHNIAKNPNWPEATQLDIYKRGRGFELVATEKQIQVVARAGLEPGTAGLRVRHADHSATLPPCMMMMLSSSWAFRSMSAVTSCYAPKPSKWLPKWRTF